MQARRKFEKILTKIIADRRSGMVQCEDLLQAMLSPMDDGSVLSDARVMDNIFTSLGAAEISTSTTIVWMVKWIYENPEVHKALKVLSLSPLVLGGEVAFILFTVPNNVSPLRFVFIS